MCNNKNNAFATHSHQTDLVLEHRFKMGTLMGRLYEQTTLKEKIAESRRAPTCRDCYRIWDKAVAATVGGVLFLVIMGTSICFTLIQCTNNSVPESNFTISARSFPSACTIASNCDVQCQNFDETFDLEQEINSVSSACVKGIKLTMESGVLAGKKIPTNWLEQLTIQVKVLKLVLMDITNIEDGAFSANSLKEISELGISQTPIGYLNRKIFKGTVSLKYFYLEFNEGKEVLIEYNFLESASLLETLQLSRCILTSKSVANITNSDVQLHNLITLDIGDSPMRYLEANIFSRAANLEVLYIRRVGLEYLELDAFNNLLSLILLHLESNRLTGLEEGIFRQIKNNPGIQIYLHGNPWECNCRLKWLKDSYLNESYISNSTSLTCNNKGNKPFEEVDFCEEDAGEESSTTQTVTVTDEGTTSNSLDNTTTCTTVMADYKVYCNKDQAKLKYYTTIRKVFLNKMEVNNIFFNFLMYETNDVPVEIVVEINTEENMAEYYLWWRDNDEISKHGCVTPLCKTLSIRGMKPTHTYTICILLNSEEMVRPENCRGFRVLEEYSERSWIKNRVKNTIIIVSIIVSTIIFLFSVCVTYWCVRCHPRLIKANEKVIIIRRQRQITPDSVATLEQSSYSTPSLSPTISSINSLRRGSIISSRSSSFSSDVTYIRPRPISHNELIYRRQYRLRPPNLLLVSTNMYENIPPMLPPRNQ